MKVEAMRKEAKWLKKCAWAGSPEARGRVLAVYRSCPCPNGGVWDDWFTHMKALHVVATEAGYASWSDVLKVNK